MTSQIFCTRNRWKGRCGLSLISPLFFHVFTEPNQLFYWSKREEGFHFDSTSKAFLGISDLQCHGYYGCKKKNSKTMTTKDGCIPPTVMSGRCCPISLPIHMVLVGSFMLEPSSSSTQQSFSGFIMHTASIAIYFLFFLHTKSPPHKMYTFVNIIYASINQHR